jgi:hypothetical protein
MKELSIFVDESGDFGEYSIHSPFYIITMVFHDQSENISDIVKNLDYRIAAISDRNLIHCGPIIRREEIYRHISLDERRRIFNSLYFFAIKAPVSVKTIIVNKKECDIDDDLALSTKLVKQLAEFIKQNVEYLQSPYTEKAHYFSGGMRGGF